MPKRERDSGYRWRQVRTPAECLAAAVVLQAVREWEHLARNGHDARPWPEGSNLAELREFFASPWCRALCEWCGIDYRRLLAHLREPQREEGPTTPRKAPARRRKGPTATEGPRLSPTTQEVLALLQGGPMTARELMERTGAAKPTVYECLRALASQGLVRRVPYRGREGRYEVVDGAQEFLPPGA